MPSQTTSPPLAVAVLAALWVGLGRCGVPESPGPGCDNGKLSLDRDLPADAGHWDCSVSTWPESTQRHPSIDTVYDPDPARQICMDEPISYNHTIPSSGAYRPVRAESGEYLYCPPQRWLNNLHHGASVLLHHPCLPVRERLVLSALARSCLSDYIITPHPQLDKHAPIALVSWGRTLELSTVEPSVVCDWLGTAAAAGFQLSGANCTGKYNLLLTRPAKQHRRQRAHPEGRSANVKESVRQCCEQTISSRLSEAVEAELGSSTEKEKEGKSRQMRAAAKDDSLTSAFSTTKTNRTVQTRTDGVQSNNNTLGSPADSSIRTLSDLPGPSETFSESRIHNLSQSPAPGPRTPLGSDVSTLRGDQVPIQTAALQLSPKHADPQNTNPSADADFPADVANSEHGRTVRPEAPALSSKDEGTDSAKQNDSKEKNYHKDVAAEGKTKDNEVVDVKERELEPKQAHGAAHSRHKSENSGFDSAPKSQSESPHHHPSPQPAAYLPGSRDCDGCRAGERCDCAKASGAEARAAVVNRGLPRTPRTDEAVWAAAALGFLLVLLTLSVLHTRLYRHWRTAPSLYWHDPRQDYDSVADVIRRRLRIANRRRKRGRRQECVLLPSSSSSDDLA